MAENIEKLPKWAQWKINKLEQDLESKRQELNAFTGTKSAITINPDAEMTGDGNLPRFLPERTTIQYELPLGTIEVDLRDGALKVLAMGRGELAVQPHSSNYIIVRLIKE